MAGSLLVPLVRGVASKAGSVLVQTVTRMCGLDNDRDMLELHLLYVERKLTSAEERSVTVLGVKRWMKKLGSVAYKADEILDELEYEALRRRYQIGESKQHQVLSHITCNSQLRFRVAMNAKLKKILQKIRQLVTEMNMFGLENSPPVEEASVPFRQTHSKPDECATIYGRDNDNQNLRSEPDYLSLQHLKEITNNFSKERILGRGGCGVVYQGILQDGKFIAVKKVESMLSSKEKVERAQKQFNNEVNLLMEIKHRNIVKLLCHCYETHSAASSADDGTPIFRYHIDSLLCLEFLPKSLANHISEATSGLDWHTRYKIIEGISYGLQYLHERSDVPIIHLDIKPGNILLDENMVPKIADFGISRVFDQGHTIQTKTTSGTIGYMPPELINAGAITPMSDIFSLGVIIMEIIMGHKDYPYDLKASSEEFINTELSKWRSMLEKEPGNTNLQKDC